MLNLTRALSQPASFEIILTSPEPLVIYGSQNSAEPSLLSGTLVLVLNEPAEVKQVKLKLRGKARVSWMEGFSTTQRSYQDKVTFISKSWDFLPFKNKSVHSLHAGRHEWNFQHIFPGDLPECVSCQDGLVNYKLTAIVERPALSVNFRKKKYFKVSRSLPDVSLELAQTVAVDGELEGKMDYTVSIPSRAHSLGDKIPVTVRLTPQVKNLQVHSLSCSLKEYTTVRTSESAGNANRTLTRIIKAIKMTDFVRTDRDVIGMLMEETAVQDGSNAAAAASPAAFAHDEEAPAVWNFVGRLTVPHAQELCNPSFKSTVMPLIQIKHKLRVTVYILNPDGNMSELTATVPIIVLSDRFSPMSRFASDPDAATQLVDDGDVVSGNVDFLPPLPLPPYPGHAQDPLGGSIVSPPLPANSLPPLPPSMPTSQQASPQLRPTDEARAVSPPPATRRRSLLTTQLEGALAEVQRQTEAQSTELSRIPSYHDAMDPPPFLPPVSSSLPNYDDLNHRMRQINESEGN